MKLADQLIYLILVENFFDLVFAGYLALLGKKVRAVVFKEELEDLPGLLLLDPLRSQMFCGRLGLPLKKEKDPYLPDFQILSEKFRLDFFWDRARREFCLSRDLGESAQKFSSLLDRLFKKGLEFEEQIREFPLLPRRNFILQSLGPKATEFILRFFSQPKIRGDKNGTLREIFLGAGISQELCQILLAPLRILSPHFQEDSPFFSSALAWRFFLSAGEGISEDRESWKSFFELISQSGILVNEEPKALEIEGKKLSELKLNSGRKIRADLFFGQPKTILSLLSEKARETRPARALAGRFPKSTIFTHFYQMSAEVWPEAMAERVCWIPGWEGEPKEFLVCARRLTGNSNLVSISYSRKGEGKPLEEQTLLENLTRLFPWLKKEQVEKKKEAKLFHQYLKPELFQIFYPQLRTSFLNFYLSPSELIPVLGFPGLFRLAERITEKE